MIDSAKHAGQETMNTDEEDIMLLIEIEKQVKPLSRAEKWRLIADVQKMLQQEELSELQQLSQATLPYALFTPVGLEEGAATLQQYLQEGKL
jgi:hypothetical protein